MAIKINNTTVIDDNAHIVGAKGILATVTGLGTNLANATVNLSTGTYFSYTTNVATAIQFTNFPTQASGTYVYGGIIEILINTGGSVVWPSSVKWPKGTAPILGLGRHLIVFTTSNLNTISATALTNFA